MMEVNYRVNINDAEVSVSDSVSGQKELFGFMAQVQEVLENDAVAKYGSNDDGSPRYVRGENIKFVRRIVDDNEYFEKRVTAGDMRGYKKSFGQNKKGDTIFGKNSIPEETDDYSFIPGMNGWHKPHRKDEA